MRFLHRSVSHSNERQKGMQKKLERNEELKEVLEELPQIAIEEKTRNLKNLKVSQSVSQ